MVMTKWIRSVTEVAGTSMKGSVKRWSIPKTGNIVYRTTNLIVLLLGFPAGGGLWLERCNRHTDCMCEICFDILNDGRSPFELMLEWMIKMEMKEVKAQIKDYVRDHYKYYGFYPYDVEVGDVLYTYEQYMDILSMTV